MLSFYSCIVLFFVYPLVVLSPLLRFIKRYQQPAKSGEFSMTDLFALTFLFQVPLLMLQMRDVRRWDSSQVIAAILMMAIPFLVWFAGLRAANHLGVSHQWKRVVLIGFTFPAAILGAFFLPSLVVVPQLVTAAIIVPAVIFCVVSMITYVSVAWVIRDCEPGVEA